MVLIKDNLTIWTSEMISTSIILDDDKPAEVKKIKNNTIDFNMSSPPNI